MPAAPIPEYDDQRIDALARYRILDTHAEEIFDRVTLMAKSMFQSRISLVSLVDRDRQWFKSHSGLDAQETPRDRAFCGYAILQREPLVVQDASQDPRFHDNPLVTSDPNIRFYAGAQLVTHDGHSLGTLCVIDDEPREFQDVDIRLLKELATIVMNEIELRIVKDGVTEKDYSTRDQSTDVYNFKTFQKLLIAECARSTRLKSPLCLALIELDHLESVGEALGDSVAEVIAKSVRSTCNSMARPSDLVARINKSKFALLMPKTKDSAAEIVVRRILKQIDASPPKIGDGSIACSISIGLATLTKGQKPRDLLRLAEKNRVSAKESGRNQYVSERVA